ncbi:unnamed protein product [Vitrella brassicaformis CCMP3155]|uniref:Mitochondrial carrier protein n=2 Tax=Vitrella brassicaformis TaxID=1169539 RepID=A0A0G4ERF3_VITBC|nr:unnamed protein product [Vitrella brassicaformis CCMP3155]|eukprot:CEM00014.1 unnamed protein product [Vitrella brassicaformis CCMP3155]
MAQTIVGHPFQTLKVRLQTQPSPPRYRNGWDCFKITVKEEGWRGLYKGITPPLLGIGLVNAVLFYAYETSKRSLLFMINKRPDGDPEVWEAALCGSFAGIANSVVSCPVELIMVRLQTQYVTSPDKQLYAGPIDCARQLVQQFGVRGLYKGFAATVIREIPNYMLFFGMYENLKMVVARTTKQRRSELSPPALFLCGGFAGVSAQLAQLPFDRVKNYIQIQSDTNPTYKGVIHCFERVLQKEGHLGFYKGVGPVLLRAFPANAACFLGFEMSVKILNAF